MGGFWKFVGWSRSQQRKIWLKRNLWVFLWNWMGLQDPCGTSAPSARSSPTEAGRMWGTTLKAGISSAASLTTATIVEKFLTAGGLLKFTNLPKHVFLCNWNREIINKNPVYFGGSVSLKIFLILLKTLLQTWRSTGKWMSSLSGVGQRCGNVVAAESRRAREVTWGNTLKRST